MDDQADPVAQPADEAGGTAPRLDKTVRKSGTATADSDAERVSEKSADGKSPGGKSPGSKPATGQATQAADVAKADGTPGTGTEARNGTSRTGLAGNTGSAGSTALAGNTVSGPDGAGSDSTGSGGTAPEGAPSPKKTEGSRRSDLTVPRSAVPLAKDDAGGGAGSEGSKPSGNGRADIPAKPFGAGAADTVVAPVPSSPLAAADRAGAPHDPPAEQASTSTLAAAALARELTGAGFASPGFASKNLSGTDAATQARSASPAPAAPPAAAETNPWVSHAAPAGPAAAAPSAWNSGQDGAGHGVTQAAAAPTATARPAYSPSGTPQAGTLAGGQTMAAQPHDVLAPPPPARAPGAPVPSKGTKPKLASPFARPGRKKDKPSAAGKPGGAIGNGRSAVSVKGKSGTLRRPVPQAAPKSTRPDTAEARDAQLVVSRIEPWSVMKFSFMVSLVGWIVLIVAVALLYFAFSSLGVFHSIEKTVGLVTSSNGSPGSNAASWFSAGTVLGYTMLAGAIDVLLITALATVGAVVYNAVTRLSGGIEITLQEAD